MTPELYLIRVRTELATQRLVKSFEFVEERAESDGGCLRIRLRLTNGDFLELAEYFVVEDDNLVPKRYRCQWMNVEQTQLRKRWDYVEHYPGLSGFPHHVHLEDGRVEAFPPRSILQLLMELGDEVSA